MKHCGRFLLCVLVQVGASTPGCDNAASPTSAGAGSAVGGAGSGGGSTSSDASSTPDSGTGTIPDAGPALTGTVNISGVAPKSTSPLFQGVNYWSWVTSYGAQVVGTESLIGALQPRLVRLGGTNADNSTPQSYSNDVIMAAVTYARAIGAEPLIQVPVLADADGNTPTAQTAADIVTYLNVTQSLGVKYFSIGNEPDIYVDNKLLAGYSVDQACQTFASFADAMKSVDPSIKIVGPDYSWKYQTGTANDWLTPFLVNCGNKIDVLSVHRYPLDPALATAEHAAADAPAFRTTLKSLRSALELRGMLDTPLAITEYNVTWDGDLAKSNLSASPGTLSAALWTADMQGVAREEQLWSLDYWSISEGWTLGMLNASVPRPAYYALQLYAEHFGPTVLATAGAPSGISVYASRNTNDDATDAVVVNWNTSDYDLVASFVDLKVSVPDAHWYAPAQSISAYVTTDTGQLLSWTYTSEQVALGIGPIVLPK